ncbi:MAG: EAL domain-containing protein [Vallitaleaceae bacterium]|nr:EAL domain-containing protein [Vallitaleaceae bacterium]
MDLYVARQPIFDRTKEVIAYELLYRDSKDNVYNMNLNESSATSILLLNSYLNFGMNLLTDNKRGFINFGPDLILEDVPHLLSQNQVVIELLETVKPDRHLLEKIRYLKTEGYIIALDDYVIDYPYQEIIDLCDIIKVDFRANSTHEIKIITNFLAEQNKILLAEKVESYEEFEFALRLGYEFFQGYFFCRPILEKQKKLNGLSYRYMQIQEELVKKEIDYKAISTLIESEVTISYKLLKLVNSSFSLINDVNSIQHALSILGIDAFQKWFSLAIIHQLGDNKPNELITVAMLRMRFMELISENSVFVQHIHSLRLIGILSVIDALLEQPMDDLMKQLPLSDSIKDTLLQKPSLYLAAFQLVLSYENGDFDKVSDYAQQIQIDFSQLPNIYLSAVNWAEELNDFLNKNSL